MTSFYYDTHRTSSRKIWTNPISLSLFETLILKNESIRKITIFTSTNYMSSNITHSDLNGPAAYYLLDLPIAAVGLKCFESSSLILGFSLPFRQRFKFHDSFIKIKLYHYFSLHSIGPRYPFIIDKEIFFCFKDSF